MKVEVDLFSKRHECNATVNSCTFDNNNSRNQTDLHSKTTVCKKIIRNVGRLNNTVGMYFSLAIKSILYNHIICTHNAQ